MSASGRGRALLPFRRSGCIQPSALFRTDAAGCSFQRRKQNSACSYADNNYLQSDNHRTADLCRSIPSYRNMHKPQTCYTAFKNPDEPEIFPEKPRTFNHVKSCIAYRTCSGGFLRNNGMVAVFNRRCCTGAFSYLSCLHAYGCFCADVAVAENQSCRSAVSYGTLSGKITFPYNLYDD